MAGWINVPIRVETRERLIKIKEELSAKSFDSCINGILDSIEKSPKLLVKRGR